MSIVIQRWRLAIFLLISEIIFIVVFSSLGDYDDTAHAQKKENNKDPGRGGESHLDTPIRQIYPMFQDVHVMIFIGFGFLMTFLKRYGFSSVAMNFLVSAFVIQWATIVRGVIRMIETGQSSFHIHISEMLTADFAAATVLISFGAILGKSSPIQLMVMAIIEVVLMEVNEWIGFNVLKVVDVGESMFIHAFGAYFGLAVTRVLYMDAQADSRKEGSVYHSDLFSMIGTIFLWMYWPSFNGGASLGDDQHRAMLNTYYSLAACCVVAFAMSALLDKRGRFGMVHIQNATLAGGVAVGTTADLMIQPWGALTIGAVAGIVSVIGYKFITPFLCRKLKVHDTCGVNNLHGMPGILAAIAGAVAAALATEERYGSSLYLHFPARAPSDTNSSELLALQNDFVGIEAGQDRTNALQGGYQMLALVVTLGIALVGGVMTGFILRLPIWGQPKGDNLFDDIEYWEIPDDGYPAIADEEAGQISKKYPGDPGNETRINLV